MQKEFINIQGDGNEESIFVNKSVSDFLRTVNLETKNCETQTDQVKEDCNEHKNKEQDTGKKELEKFLDNIDLNASPVKPDNTHILYERLITNLQSDVLFLREQLKTRDVYFKEEITYLRNQLDDCLGCFHCSSKTENNTSIHKSKPNSLVNFSAPESTEKQKDNTFKKNYIDVNKKDSSNGSNQVVTTDKSIQQPDNGKQAPKEKEKSGNSNNEKQTKKKKIYILGDSMIKHLKGYDISAKLKQRHNIYVRPFTGAKVRSMKDYAKPCIREENPDHIIVFKKDDRTDKSNYRPISILPNLSKVFEKCIYNELSIFLEKVLSKYQCGFRKGFSAQHCLLKLLEQWKESVDQGLVFGALLTDLSKAFDCLSHELLIAKFSAYGMEDSAVRFVSDYLTNRKQRTKIGNNYSSWSDVLFGVPQGSILGPLLFNIYPCDLFLLVCNIDVASYADDTTPYVTGDNIESTVRQLEQAAKLLFQWFSDNQMKGNEDKCHVLISTKENVCVNIGTTQITNSACEKLLGIKVDSSLNFEYHIGSICKKAGAKLNALTRIANHMPFQERKLLMNAFFTSQFSYCPLTWMFHSRKLNNKINRLHERCLRVVYNDRLSTFEELMNKDNSVSIHHRNIQCLATEMFKVHLGEAPQILNEVFPLSEPSAYNLRFQTEFSTRPIRTVHHGSNSLRYLGPKIWEIAPSEIKCCKRVDVFKSKIQKWRPLNCPCRLCDTYIHQVGFI